MRVAEMGRRLVAERSPAVARAEIKTLGLRLVGCLNGSASLALYRATVAQTLVIQVNAAPSLTVVMHLLRKTEGETLHPEPDMNQP